MDDIIFLSFKCAICELHVRCWENYWTHTFIAVFLIKSQYNIAHLQLLQEHYFHSITRWDTGFFHNYEGGGIKWHTHTLNSLHRLEKKTVLPTIMNQSLMLVAE